jgi:hypothetical protein
MKSDQIVKRESFDPTEIPVLERNEKAEPSTNSSQIQTVKLNLDHFIQRPT